MSRINLDERTIQDLKGRSVVLTGGAQGIGAKTAMQLFRAGARLVISDIDHTQGQELVVSMEQEAHGHGSENEKGNYGHVTFVHGNVSDYASMLSLFRQALNIYGCVDMAIHCAAVSESVHRPWFSKDITLESIQEPPSTKVLDINLLGTFYFTQVALAAMRQHRSPGDRTGKSITLISSVAGFKESPGLFAYSASKHGVLGLMRSLRRYLLSAFDVRINVVCPWATDTPMLGGVRERWVRESLPMNTPDQVARLILQCAGDPDIHGKAVYVAGGEGFDIEEGINRLEPDWLGEQQAADLAKGQGVLGLLTRHIRERLGVWQANKVLGRKIRLCRRRSKSTDGPEYRRGVGSQNVLGSPNSDVLH
ncbi:short-chain dehydrogenase/reductase SDR [Dactylonectria macrodidyma]|uniref:Short-chain dehydrogenase/reductase SDR n=1 Tax=Dactylonectria macrodidyma TaxID=307937 RepID=A0A9P9DRW5_9HYPO|nr:short-chain dehydrogenase/reductase SDR [Dactylonectria macrodidyma]